MVTRKIKVKLAISRLYHIWLVLFHRALMVAYQLNNPFPREIACQLDALRRCFPASIRRVLNDQPMTSRLLLIGSCRCVMMHDEVLHEASNTTIRLRY